MLNEKKVARFMLIGALCLGFLYLEKLKNESKDENA